MILSGIEVRQEISNEQGAFIAQQGGPLCLAVTLRFAASPEEVATVGRMLVSGQRPPREFWEALGWGEVSPNATRSERG